MSNVVTYLSNYVKFRVICLSTFAVLINIVTFYFYSAEQMFMKSTLRNSWYLNINFEIFILNKVGGLLFFANIFPHEERMFLDVDDYGWPIGGSVLVEL